MKHLLYTLLGILLLAGCKEDKYNVIIPMSDIYLSAPQDGTKIDLNDLSIDEYSFSWDKALEKGAKLILCATRDFKKPVKIDAGKSTSFTLSVLAADQYFSQLGIKAGQEALLYWTVKETGNTTAAAPPCRRPDLGTHRRCRLHGRGRLCVSGLPHQAHDHPPRWLQGIPLHDRKRDQPPPGRAPVLCSGLHR